MHRRVRAARHLIAGSLDGPGGVLDFRTRPHFQPVILNPDGSVASGGGGKKS